MALTVNTTNDTHAANPSASALDGDGNVSLRAALEYLNATGAPGAITFQSGLKGTIALGSTLAITDTGGVTIDATGAAVTVSGQGAVQVLHVAAGVTASIAGLTLAGGHGAGTGGGVYNGGALTLTGDTITGSYALSGAGVYNSSSGTLTIADTTIQGNGGDAAGTPPPTAPASTTPGPAPSPSAAPPSPATSRCTGPASSTAAAAP